jgi:glucose/arabinose dehydrogenase
MVAISLGLACSVLVAAGPSGAVATTPDDMGSGSGLGATAPGLSTSVPLPSAAVPSTVLPSATSHVRLVVILSGYSHPVQVTAAPGGGRTIFIVEQTGRIRRATYRDGRWRDLGVFLDLRAWVNDPLQGGNGERGLLGLAFHPHYGRNGRFYVYYTRAAAGTRDGDVVVAEYRRADARHADPASARRLLVIDEPYANHNGGQLVFGPDGKLYIGTGDGGSGGDPQGNAQRLSSRLGKILRIDPRDPDGPGPRRYRTPASNPLVGRRGDDAIWAWGLRNPWRFSFDRANGDLWIGDVGQGAREEVDRARANSAGRGAGRGRDFGWNRCEGTRAYPQTTLPCRWGTRPIHDYAHGAGRCAVTGGVVHRGPDARGWRGLYVAGDYCGRLFVLDGRGRVRLARATSVRFSSFGQDAAGRIFATDVSGGTVYRVRFDGPRP